MLELMHRTGIRVGELCGVYLAELRPDGDGTGEIHLRAAATKGKKAPAIFTVDAFTMALLERWLIARQPWAAAARAWAKANGEKPHLFIRIRSGTGQGGPVTRGDVWKVMQRLAQRAGIDGQVSPHMLRHTFATELLREGYNIREVQELMRHRHVSTTEIYTHVSSNLRERLRLRELARRG
jgi:integrase/recombinase XerD